MKQEKQKIQDVLLAYLGIFSLSLDDLLNGVGSAKGFFNIGENAGEIDEVVDGPIEKRSATYSWSTISSEGNNWISELSFVE